LTKDDVTQLSGRGLGLSVVKNEVDKLFGSIEVKTEQGKGTEFQLILPYEPLYETPDITISRIINPLVSKTRNLINDDITVISDVCENILINQVEKIQLLKYTVFVSIKGLINGKVLLSVDEGLARMITRKFVMQAVTPEEETELIEDALAECTNIIVGNSFKLIPELEDLIIMETPITINSEFASFNCPASRMWNVEITLGSGKMRLGFTSLDNIAE
jgi:CheY-specific phosphatase CheX